MNFWWYAFTTVESMFNCSISRNDIDWLASGNGLLFDTKNGLPFLLRSGESQQMLCGCRHIRDQHGSGISIAEYL
jgi:hypothetical protein